VSANESVRVHRDRVTVESLYIPMTPVILLGAMPRPVIAPPMEAFEEVT